MLITFLDFFIALRGCKITTTAKYGEKYIIIYKCLSLKYCKYKGSNTICKIILPSYPNHYMLVSIK